MMITIIGNNYWFFIEIIKTLTLLSISISDNFTNTTRRSEEVF
jgi:hypothetical protein